MPGDQKPTAIEKESQVGSRKERLMNAGAVAGIILSVFFAIMWIAAVIVNGNWRLGESTLSELGGQVPSRWIFNSAVIIGGLLGIVFSLGIYSRLGSSITGKAGCIAMMIASFGLISIGIFPIDTGEPHTVASIFFFSVAAASVIILLRPVQKWVGTRGAPFIISVAILVVTFACLFTTPVPFTEAVAVAGLLVWVLALSIWMIRERGVLDKSMKSYPIGGTE